MRLIMVSNRLPVTARRAGSGFEFERSVGGLATGLDATLHSTQTDSSFEKHLWIGWPGITVDQQDHQQLQSTLLSEFNAHPVFLSEQSMENFYHGFCNRTIWALFHYFPSYAVYEEAFWKEYREVNESFCNAILEIAQPGDVFWIHDYHLMLLPRLLRERIPEAAIGFFLHIPFPSFEVFRLLPSPWRSEILKGLLGADLVGFHTHDYVHHFLRCTLALLNLENQDGELTLEDRVARVDSFPMGIDFQRFHKAAENPHIHDQIVQLKQTLGDKRLVLSVDRLDYSKGIAHRLRGYELFLQENPDWHGKVVLLLVVVPSRIGVHRYQLMKQEIDEIVGKINGRFGVFDWVPIIYQYKTLEFEPLVSFYSVSDVILVTPLRDGMNLIAKEYVAARSDQTGVLILSEMAGSAKELIPAIIINPNTPNEIASALKQALDMPVSEQKRRNRDMQLRLKRYDVTRWTTDFLSSLTQVHDNQGASVSRRLTSGLESDLIAEFHSARERILLVDYDGSLVPFSGDPRTAIPDPELLSILRNASHQAHLVMLSGRDRATLEEWFGALPISMVSEHGAWIKLKGDEWKMQTTCPDSEWKSDLISVLQTFADKLPGAFVEEKEFSVVFHYRQADPNLAAIRVKSWIDYLAEMTDRMNLNMLRGNKVVEIRMPGVDKGKAGLSFLSENRYDFCMAIGDDVTDEELFRALPSSACTIKVGTGVTAAKFRLRNYQHARKLLRTLVETSSTTQ